MFKMEFRFSKLAKSIVFKCPRANKAVGCSEYALRNRQGKQVFVKEIFKKIKKKEI